MKAKPEMVFFFETTTTTTTTTTTNKQKQNQKKKTVTLKYGPTSLRILAIHCLRVFFSLGIRWNLNELS